MRWIKILIAISILLLLNYFLGWNYEKNKENRITVHDSVVVAASHKYSRVTPLKYFFLGKNYRREWCTPVAMPVFHIESTKGGFAIGKLGGGQQTKTLHLIAKNGSKWVLRTVDKDVTEAMPSYLRHTIFQNIVQDQISAAYPYAQLTIQDLSQAIEIPCVKTELFYVPNDNALGKFRSVFANTVCLLSPKKKEGSTFSREETDTVRAKLEADNYYKVLQEQTLKVRLLDMLIADWDRHKNQWKWGSVDSVTGKYFFPIAEDRDQAYFLSCGAFPFLARFCGMPQLIGFKKTSTHLKQLNHKALSFDNYFLNNIDRKNFKRIIFEFQKALTDNIIHGAIKKLPPEIYAISGREIEAKLKSRRDGLLENGLDYYKFLASSVTITGSKSPEMYFVNNFKDSIEIIVRSARTNEVLYRRIFFPDETKNINIVNIDEHDKINRKGKENIPINLEYSDFK